MSRNPYFNGILSAMSDARKSGTASESVAILILMESFLQYTYIPATNEEVWCRNPYFNGILSAIL